MEHVGAVWSAEFMDGDRQRVSTSATSFSSHYAQQYRFSVYIIFILGEVAEHARCLAKLMDEDRQRETGRKVNNSAKI